MATVNSTYQSALLQTTSAPATVNSAATSSASGSSGDGFGSAYTLSISDSSTSSSSGSSAAAAPAPGGSAPAGGPPGGGVPVTGTTTTSTALETLIEEAKNKAAVDIGYTEAANVVDSQGNIETAKLQQIEAQQAAQAAAQKQVLNPISQSAGQAINLVA